MSKLKRSLIYEEFILKSVEQFQRCEDLHLVGFVQNIFKAHQNSSHKAQKMLSLAYSAWYCFFQDILLQEWVGHQILLADYKVLLFHDRLCLLITLEPKYPLNKLAVLLMKPPCV